MPDPIREWRDALASVLVAHGPARADSDSATRAKKAAAGNSRLTGQEQPQSFIRDEGGLCTLSQ